MNAPKGLAIGLDRVAAILVVGLLVGSTIGAAAVSLGAADPGPTGDQFITQIYPDGDSVDWDASVNGDGNWTSEIGAYVDRDRDTILYIYTPDGSYQDGPDPTNDTRIDSAFFSGGSGWLNTTWGDDESPPSWGSNEWYVLVEDYGTGNTVIEGPYNFTIPGIDLRSERTGNDQGGNVEATITVVGTGEFDVDVSAQTVDGVTAIPLTTGGFFGQSIGPLNGTQITVDMRDTSGTYADRTVTYTDPGFERAYLAPTNEGVVNVTFSMVDRSGDFPPESTVVQLTRYLDGQQRQITGDVFGANSETTMTLTADTRYRIRVENGDGDVRTFGPYRANVEGDLVTLDVGDVTLEPVDEGSYWFNAYETTVTTQKGDVPAIKYVWVDDGPNTDELDVRIYEQNNESNQIHSKTYTDVSEVRTTVALTDNESEKSWVVEYNATRQTGDGDTETVTGFQTVGGLGDLALPVSNQALQGIAITAILLTAGLFGGRLSQIGGIVTVGVAWVFWSIGWLDLPIEFLAAAAVVAFLFKIGTPDSGGIYS